MASSSPQTPAFSFSSSSSTAEQPLVSQPSPSISDTGNAQTSAQMSGTSPAFATAFSPRSVDRILSTTPPIHTPSIAGTPPTQFVTADAQESQEDVNVREVARYLEVQRAFGRTQRVDSEPSGSALTSPGPITIRQDPPSSQDGDSDSLDDTDTLQLFKELCRKRRKQTVKRRRRKEIEGMSSSSTPPTPTLAPSSSSSSRDVIITGMSDPASVLQTSGTNSVGVIPTSSYTSTGSNALEIREPRVMPLRVPTSYQPTSAVSTPVVPSQIVASSDTNSTSILTNVVASFASILNNNQMVMSQITSDLRRHPVSTPFSPFPTSPPFSDDPLSPQNLLSTVQSPPQLGVDLNANMQVGRYDKAKVRFAWCTPLSITPFFDLDDWFMKFERLLCIDGIEPRLWFKALVQRTKSPLTQILARMPSEEVGNYEKVRDFICIEYGPRAALIDVETSIREIPAHGLTMMKMLEEVDRLIEKYRRIAVREKEDKTEIEGRLVLTIIKSCLPHKYDEFKHQIDLYISQKKTYESVRAVIVGRLVRDAYDTLPRTRTEKAPRQEFKHTSSHLEDADKVKAPIISTLDGLAVNEAEYSSDEEPDTTYNIGPMHKARMRESGLLSNKQGSNPPKKEFKFDNRKCFYCGQSGHFKADCPLRKYHESKGKVLVDRNRTRNLVHKLTDRSRNASRVFFIRRPYAGRFNRNQGIRPQGSIRAIRMPYRRRPRPDRQFRPRGWSQSYRFNSRRTPKYYH